MKKHMFVLATAMLAVLGMGFGAIASAQTAPVKTLAGPEAGFCTAPAANVGDACTANADCDSAPLAGDGVCPLSGPNPVGTSKTTSTQYVFKIEVTPTGVSTQDVVDVVPAEFDVSEVAATCGAPTAVEVKKPGDKLRPDRITWNLEGGTACADDALATLVVVIQTDQNPGAAKKGVLRFEPTSCGPLALNDGANVIDDTTREVLAGPSNQLSVATCRDEASVAGCVDADDDGWSVDCGDTVDDDPSVYPGAPEICGDGKDNDLDGTIDDGCGA